MPQVCALSSGSSPSQGMTPAKSLLQLPVPQGEDSSGVTPQIFARPLVAAVVAHIRQLVKKEV
jgi:hypothetical protein